MPKFLGEIKQAGGDYALLDSSNLRGGFMSVPTFKDLDSIVEDKRKEGMLVLIVNTGRLYEWKNNKWLPFYIGETTSETECRFLTPSQKVTEILDPIVNEEVEYIPIIVNHSEVFKDGDILGWDLVANSDGTIEGVYTEIAYIMEGVIYLYNTYEIPPVDSTIYLVGSTSDDVRRNVIVRHLYHGAIVLSQFLNISIDNINTNYTFRLGQSDVNYWKLYAEDVYLKGTFIDDKNRNLSDLVTLNQETINTGLSSIRREFEYDNLLNNPYFIDGLDYWVTKNTATYFKVKGKFILSNKALISTKKGGAYVIVEDGANVLRLINGYISQKNINLKKVLDLDDEIRDTNWITLIFSYNLISSGKLTVSMDKIPNKDNPNIVHSSIIVDRELSTEDNYEVLRISFPWDGLGDFNLNYTGEIKLKSLVMKINELKNLEEKLKSYLKN